MGWDLSGREKMVLDDKSWRERAIELIFDLAELSVVNGWSKQLAIYL